MNQLQIFNNAEFGTVRVVEIDGSPWFVAADICRVLDIQNTSDALSRLDVDEKGIAITDTPGGKQKLLTVNESGLYAPVLTSRKPNTKKFRKWVTSEVIPSIRKMQPKASYYDRILQCKDLVSTSTIAKDYGFSARTFNKILHKLGVQFKQGGLWLLYQRYASQIITHYALRITHCSYAA